MAEQYLTITPAGSLLTTQCVATGHAHTSPDIPVGVQCEIHHAEWVLCAACKKLWCPGTPGRDNGHQGVVTTPG